MVEEPLEIRVCFGSEDCVVTVTMRTPGEDEDLALGFLITERVIDEPAQVARMRVCGMEENVLRVELAVGVVPRLQNVARLQAATASCGLCGKSSLEAVTVSIPGRQTTNDILRVAPATLHAIPARLRLDQSTFERTGGLHAVAAFSVRGELLALGEDIGRHNAFDKLLGVMLKSEPARINDSIIALSGRAGFELVQKAAVVGVPMVVAIGAPSTLAVDLAERTGMTLVGFLRDTSFFNVYCHSRRIAAPDPSL